VARKKGGALAKAAAKAYEKAKATSKPGQGNRFAALSKAIAARGGVDNPDAVAAAIGRKKWGKEKMAKWAAKGRKKNG
jgi:hypothetical protein